ncbi:MAG TPA: nucleoside triphosphate pyrophosphohydrolase [Acidobacteriaceae bacterium]|nr:nucleoside triphosphate pyrophosphohydrolase [Acidobacteriaceae bacterium]
MNQEAHIEGEEAQAEAAAALGRAAAIMARLRAPGGCPWDREQSFDTIKPYTLEETYEVFDAIERRAWPELKDELGDLLLQVLFYAQMAEEAGYFTLRDVAENLSAKLIRRHPHVFADVEASDAKAVLRNWEQIKIQEKLARSAREEKQAQPATGATRSMLGDIPRSMPAMMEAAKLGSRAAQVGFDWPDVSGLFEKLAEEAQELRAEVVAHSVSEVKQGRERIEDELGDLLFTVVNLARHLKIDPEFALRGSNAKFRERFAAMEEEAGGAAGLESLSAEELDSLWSRAKRHVGQAAAEETR